MVTVSSDAINADGDKKQKREENFKTRFYNVAPLPSPVPLTPKERISSDPWKTISTALW